MAKKKVDVVIGAKNKMMTGLRSATKSLRKFGRGAGKLMKNVAKGVAVVGVAVLALSVKMVKAWSIQESAEKSLSEALLAQGDSVDTLMVKYKKLASAIQDETGVGDESTLALIAKLRTIGVTNAKMEDAVKLTMALSKAGMREKTAFRAAADAMNGNTTALTTYIPELRQATTQAEKMAVVNSLAVRGYKQLSGELDTNAGRWTELKGRIGDVFERIGKVISGGLDLKNTMAKLSDKIKAFGSSPKFDAFLRRLQNGIRLVKDLIKVLSRGGSQAQVVMANIANVFLAVFRVAGEKVASILLKAAPEVGRLIAKGMAGMVAAEAGRMGTRSAAAGIVKSEMKAERAAGRINMGGSFGTGIGSDEFMRRVDEMTSHMIQLNAAANDRKMSTKGLTVAESELKNKLDILKKSIPQSSVFSPIVKRTEGNKSSVTGGVAGTNDLSGSTSMLGVGELFTMMQFGQGKSTPLGEAQKTNQKLDKLIEVTENGGVQE